MEAKPKQKTRHHHFYNLIFEQKNIQLPGVYLKTYFTLNKHIIVIHLVLILIKTRRTNLKQGYFLSICISVCFFLSVSLPLFLPLSVSLCLSFPQRPHTFFCFPHYVRLRRECRCLLNAKNSFISTMDLYLFLLNTLRSTLVLH